MRKTDIFDKSRIKPRCLPKAKLFVEQLLEIACDIAPVLVRAKEGLDELDDRPSDHNKITVQKQMLYLSQKIKHTMKAVEDCYESYPKGVKTIFNRDVMIELFISMIQECIADYNNGSVFW